jgi:hypothetical protein
MKKITLLILIVIALSTHIISAQNAPVTTVGTKMSNGTTTIVPVTATGFNNIGSCNLKLMYDPAIATVTSVTKGPLLVGNLATNLSVPGVISLGWYTYPGTTLPNNTIIFNISFSKVMIGTTNLTWVDDGYSCIYYDGSWNPLNDLPTSTYYINGALTFQSPYAAVTTAPQITACSNTPISVPVRVDKFINVGALSLTLNYNSSVLDYTSSTNNSGFPGLTINEPVPGTIIIGGYTSSGVFGITLTDNTVLFTLYFDYLGGSTDLTWYDDGESCEYADYPDLNPFIDTPTATYYINGSVSPKAAVELKLFLEGLFNTSTGEMNKARDYVGGSIVDKFTGTIVDLIAVELHDPNNYGHILQTITDIPLNQNGTASFCVPEAISGSFYITVRTRNHLETVSATPVSFTSKSLTWDFTSAASQAYGSNMKLLATGVWGIFAGDVNQEGYINISDAVPVNNDIAAGEQGYKVTDINGDANINISDAVPVNNNIAAGIQKVTP